MKITLQKTILLAFTLLISSFLIGQEEDNLKYFISFKAGKKSPLGISTEESQKSVFYKTPEINLGSGYEAELIFGYQFNKNIGVEAGFSYFKNDETITINYEDSFRKQFEYLSGSIIQFKPSVVFNSGFKKVNPYIKTGINLAIKKNIHRNTLTESYDGTRDFKSISDGSDFPLGFHSSFGIEFKVIKKIVLFSEFSINVLKLKKVSYKGYYFFNDDTNTNNNNYENGIGGLLLPISDGSLVSISNYGFDLGIKYHL